MLQHDTWYNMKLKKAMEMKSVFLMFMFYK